MSNTITIEFEVGNECFSGDNLAGAIQDVLDSVKANFEGMTREQVGDMGPMKIHDVNGNTIGRLWVCIDDDDQWVEADAYCSTIHRDHCVEILEDRCGVQCYDHETVAELREAVLENIKDGTISFEDVKSHCGD